VSPLQAGGRTTSNPSAVLGVAMWPTYPKNRSFWLLLFGIGYRLAFSYGFNPIISDVEISVLYCTNQKIRKSFQNRHLRLWALKFNLYPTRTRNSATAEIARDADNVDFSVDDVHSALTLAFNSFNSIIILQAFYRATQLC